MMWWAQLTDGTPATLVSYAQISALIQSTPADDRQRFSDGSLVVGLWRFWRQS